MIDYKLDKEINKISLKRLIDWVFLFLIFSFIVSCGNYISTGASIINSFIGMLILSAMAYVCFILERITPHNISSIIWVSLIGIILALPMVPTSQYIVPFVKSVDLTAIITVYLAYVGISMGRDWEQFKKFGWRGAIVTCFVIMGTFLSSVFIAQICLTLFHII
ncbi:hypothetical protein [uncultured Methanobrevibacter sp.]|uniref:hypothetical protein n=1 Tax=uncultured Methanobrevibacter sp. TaxID=253161 RepID=UPI0025F1F6B9|nr:hypothetical protein [uncultured Methanobrevibacter sp.]